MARRGATAEPLIAVIYARYSSTAQNDASIEQQVRAAQDYAARHGLRVIAVYEDRAKTGKRDNRPSFQKLLADAGRCKFQVVIAWKSNRIGRNMLQAMQNEAKLQSLGVRCVYVEETFDDTAAGRFAQRNMMNVNQFYSENMAEDIRRGMRDGAAQCRVMFQIPFGYRKGADGKHEIEEADAEIVREIFHRVAAGDTYAEIVRDLNVRGIRTKRGAAWGKNSLGAILSNERYIGVYIYDDIRVEGGMPQIISREVFDVVTKKRETMGIVRRRHRSNADYLLTGKLFCGKCFAPMVGCSGAGNGGEYFYYACQSKRRHKNCDKQNVRRDWIERTVCEAICTYILTDDMVETIADVTIEYQKKLSGSADAARHVEELKDTKRRIQNIIRAISNGIELTDDVRTTLDDLNASKKELESIVAADKLLYTEVTREQVVYWLEHFRGGDLDDAEFRKKLISEFIESVYLYDDHLKLSFDYTGERQSINVPASPEPSESDADLVRLNAVQVYHNSIGRTSIEFKNGQFALIYYFENVQYE